MCNLGPLVAKAQQRGPTYPINFITAEVYPAGGETPGQGVKPYGIAIADVVGPGPDYLPDGLPDVAVALYETQNGPTGYWGRVVIFRNTGDWANDGQNNGLVFFSQIDFPTYIVGGSQARPPYDLKWVDIDRDPLHYDLDLVVVTAGDDVQQELLPPAAVWVIRNNCTTEPSERFELLFDSNQNWPYPIDFEGWNFPGLDVDELTGDSLPDVVCGGLDPISGKAAVQVFANLGGLKLADETVWTDAGMPGAFGSAVVTRRTRFDATGPPEADVMMSLVPESGVDKTLVLHPDGSGGFVSASQDGKRGYGLALQELRPCELGLVSTFWHESQPAVARVMFLDSDGDIIGVPPPIDYTLVYDPSPPSLAWGVATGRLDVDGLWDFVVAFGGGGPWLHSGGGVAVFRNDPATPGTFLPPSYFDTHPGLSPPGPGPTFVVVADMDNDLRPDLIVSNTLSNTIAVLINAN